MLAITATYFARNLSQLLDQVEQKGVSIRIFRNQKPIATLTPQVAQQSAMEAFGDLYRPLEHMVDDDWLADIQRANTSIDGQLGNANLGTQHDPWL